eukprot:363694-Chlamydomonas_euryale.AAC.25
MDDACPEPSQQHDQFVHGSPKPNLQLPRTCRQQVGVVVPAAAPQPVHFIRGAAKAVHARQEVAAAAVHARGGGKRRRTRDGRGKRAAVGAAARGTTAAVTARARLHHIERSVRIAAAAAAAAATGRTMSEPHRPGRQTQRGRAAARAVPLLRRARRHPQLDVLGPL